MLVPLMLGEMLASYYETSTNRVYAHLPETLIITALVLPKFLHIRQGSISACRFEDATDVLVLPALVAKLRVSAIAEVGP